MKRVSVHFFRQYGFSVVILAWNLAEISLLQEEKIKKFDPIS